MSNNTIEFSPSTPIPAHLISQVQSKLAYVDESITAAHVAETGDQITLQLRAPLNKVAADSFTHKIQIVVWCSEGKSIWNSLIIVMVGSIFCQKTVRDIGYVCNSIGLVERHPPFCCRTCLMDIIPCSRIFLR